MKTQEVNVSAGSNVSVALSEDALNLETVVITGYGVQRKAAFTGAATTVGEELVTKQSGANVISNLQGTVPGVQISITSGSPGASSPVLMRGLGSVNASSAPLYILDGVPMVAGNYSEAGQTSVDPIASLNPDDIANISFLKDASATSIYGSRASNGVIVITTKRGQTGKSNISFGMRVGWNAKPILRRNNTLLSKEDYITMLRTALNNAGNPNFNPGAGKNLDPYTKEPYVGDDPTIERIYGINLEETKDINTDWWDAITKQGILQEYNLSASGGNAGTKYYISGSYYQNQGSIIGSGTKRYSVRLNLENNLNKYITLENILAGSYSITNGLSTNSGDGIYYSNPIFAARSNLPFEPIKNPDGTWNFKTSASGFNPVAQVEDKYPNVLQTDIYRATYSPTIRVNVLKDLFVQVKGGLDYTLSQNVDILSPTASPDGKNWNGSNYESKYQEVTLVNTNTINWMPQFNKHSLNIMLGQEMQSMNANVLNGMTVNFASPKLINSLGNGSVPMGTSGGSTEETLLSFLANAEYSYDDKYYFSASVREDGSSKFLGKNKWGTFFSVGAKYRMSQENFMRAVDKWLQNLTVRISYGTTGNQDLGTSFPAMGLYSFSSSYYGNPASGPAQLESSDLTWETRKKFNVGFEALLLDRIGIELDYFYDVVDDMLFAVPISRTTGFSGLMQNVGTMSNTGVEGTLNFLLVKSKNVTWTFNVNFTHYKNIVKKLSPGVDSIIGGATLKTAGLPWNTIWVRNFQGITDNGVPLWNDAAGYPIYDIAKANLSANRVLAGTSDPDLYGGFGTRVDFFGFDLSLQFIYSIGGVAFNDAGQFNEFNKLTTGTPSNITYYAWENSFKDESDKGDATLPIIMYGRDDNWFYALWSEEHLHPLDYLKLRNLTFGYTLPKRIVNKAKMSNLRVYFSCDNVFSLYNKKYRGFDTDPGGIAQANYGFNYPISRNYVFGLNLTF
jgi:TonB-linked SusC/RagA family outer membrane protein